MGGAPGNRMNGHNQDYIETYLQGIRDITDSISRADIDDVVEANLLAAHAAREVVASRVINAATGTEKTLNEAFRLLKAFTGFAGEPAYGPARAGDVRKSVADVSLARELLGYTPKVEFAEGLYRTLQWYREQSQERAAEERLTENQAGELLQTC